MSNTVEFKIKLTDLSGNVVKDLIGNIEGADDIVKQLTQSVKDAAEDALLDLEQKWGGIPNFVDKVRHSRRR